MDATIRPGASTLLLTNDAGEQSSVPMISGSLHYYHLKKDAWPRCLDKAKALGLEVVQSYVPWAIHERRARNYDFQSADDRYERDLPAFLRACHERELNVILRPGPHINGELTGFGYPWRLLEDKRIQARGAKGNAAIFAVPPRAFPVPSYASEHFLEEADHWLNAFTEIVAPYCFPHGPLVAAQVDNELSFFFRTGAYDLDYHPDSLALYRRFLSERYDDALPACYGAGANADGIEPPRSFAATTAADLLPHLDWLRFKEWSQLHALRRLAQPLRQALPGLPLIHNFPGSLWGESLSVAEAETVVDIAGYDLYPRGRDHQGVKELCSKLAGDSRLPLIPELACGSWPWWFPAEEGEQQQNALSALMYGVRGFNLYMLADRDRWYGAPLSADGREEHPKYEEVRRLIQSVKTNKLYQLERKVEVALLVPREYYHLSLCTSLIDPLAPMALSLFQLGPQELCREESFGLSCAIQIDAFQFIERIRKSLDELGLPYHQLDSQSATEKLSTYKLIVVPSYDFLNHKLVANLNAFAKQGGCVLYGPQKPSLDECLTPADLAIDGEFVADTQQLEGQLAHWAKRCKRTFLPQGDIELCCYEDTKGPRVIFAANTSDTTQSVDLSLIFDQSSWCCDGLSGAPLPGRTIEVKAAEVRMICCKEASSEPETKR